MKMREKVPVSNIPFTFEKIYCINVPGALIETQYLPPVSYFIQLQPFDKVVIEKHEYYVKQSYRNRCCINTARGTDRLVVPVAARHGKIVIADVRIDYSQKWLNRHWRAIQSAYGKAPFFEFYGAGLHEVLFRRNRFLYDLNMQLLSLCLKWLRLEIPITESTGYEKETPGSIIDLRNTIKAKKSAECAESNFPVIYTQVFGSKFAPDLSVVDLVFCTGPDAGLLVQSGAKGLMNK
ncbi:MAG TPA: WbqC family protein [Cyclobacteriaceae bacterium]